MTHIGVKIVTCVNAISEVVRGSGHGMDRWAWPPEVQVLASRGAGRRVAHAADSDRVLHGKVT